MKMDRAEQTTDQSALQTFKVEMDDEELLAERRRQWEQFLDALASHLTIGAIGRVSRTCRDARAILMTRPIVAHALGFKSIACMERMSLSARMTMQDRRCNECGKFRTVAKHRRFSNRTCMHCARDERGYRFHMTIDEALREAYKLTSWMPTKRSFRRAMTPRMFTQTRAYLYAAHEVRVYFASK